MLLYKVAESALEDVLQTR